MFSSPRGTIRVRGVLKMPCGRRLRAQASTPAAGRGRASGRANGRACGRAVVILVVVAAIAKGRGEEK